MHSKTPGHRSLRKGRYSIQGQTYLLTATTYDRKNFFEQHNSARLFCRCLNQITVAGSKEIICWVLMPDHFHLLIQLDDEPLSVLMRRIKSISAIAINKILERNGSLGSSAYHDHALRKDEDIKAVARYVIYNPVRAGLVAKPGDYPYWDAMWL